MRSLIAIAPLALLAACGLNGTDGTQDQADSGSATSAVAADDNGADAMASDDAKLRRGAVQEPRPVMQVQLVLERLGFGPGVIDGKMGLSTNNALKGFQEANGLTVTGELTDETVQALARWKDIPSTRQVTIPADWGTTAYVQVPDSPVEQAKLDRLGYNSLDERLAERFHTTVEVLHELNSAPATGATGTPIKGNAEAASAPAAEASSATISPFRAGQKIVVPNVGGDRIEPGAIEDGEWLATMASLGVGSEQAKVARIVVDKSEGWLKGYDQGGKLVAMFTVTTGSSRDPLPLGEWGVNGVARNTPFAFDPDLFWDVADHVEDQQLPPGPNGPVGVVWIDITKEHYGIHGTPEPQNIGRTQSHGCVRLTNWDAARLAQMVSGSTKILFQA